MPKKYSKELKEKAVRRVVVEGKTIKSVNEEYGLGAGSLNGWIKRYKAQQPKEKLTEDQKIKKLVKENKELRKENEFLKKASAFFAAQNKEDLDI